MPGQGGTGTASSEAVKPGVWSQSLTGRALELLHPTVAQVDFLEICDTLSTIHRYTGAASKPVSVALHTLIAVDAAGWDLKPWVLLHDFHEARIGDIGTPQAEALAETAREICGDLGFHAVRDAIREAKHRHDVVIHQAAGLALPNARQIIGIRASDIRALATERRDFLARCDQRWHSSIEAIEPLPRVYRRRPDAAVADDLYALCKAMLPLFGAPVPSPTTGEPVNDDGRVPCACGCGGLLKPIDGKGRSRRFLNGHNARGAQPAPGVYRENQLQED